MRALILDARTILELGTVLERRIGFYNTERYHSSHGNQATLVFIQQEHPEYAQLHI